jgi:hypothetical protein
MNLSHFPLIVTLAALLVGGAAQAQQQRVYQWKDANGVTHYTDQPPAQRHTMRDIDIRTGTSATSTDPTTPESDTCKNARGNLKRLQSGDAIGMDTDGDGKADRNLSADEIKAQIELNQAAINAYCTSDKGK